MKTKVKKTARRDWKKEVKAILPKIMEAHGRSWLYISDIDKLTPRRLKKQMARGYSASYQILQSGINMDLIEKSFKPSGDTSEYIRYRVVKT